MQNSIVGVYKKIQVCSKMGTKIFKIDDEMPEIIDSKVGNPKVEPFWATPEI